MRVTIIKSDVRGRENPCLRCGYSLRKIDAQHCPECGLSVWLSLNANDHLDRSNPDWLRRMAWGLIVMAVAMLPGVLSYALGAKHRVDYAQQRVAAEKMMRHAMEADPDDFDPRAYRALMTPPRHSDA